MDVRVIEEWPAGLLEEWAAFYTFDHKMRVKAERQAARERKRGGG